MGLPSNAILDMAYTAVEVLGDYVLKLELGSSKEPHLYTVCSLELPTLEPYTFVIVSMVDKEWVPTASCDASACSQLLRKRVIPFHSSKVSTIGLLKEYKMRTASVRVLPSCWMTISIMALLSAIHSDAEPGHASVCTVPWAKWGSAAMCILLNIHGARLPKLAGPFWITGSSPVAYRDYDMLWARCT
jgi:hypothetical protein